MQFKIHDVGHGSCVVAVGPEGHRLMLDCGYSIDRPWFPSIHYSGLEIQTLMITNLDEDHVEDLPDLWRKVRINGIFSNPTIDAAALRKMKTQGMRAGVQQAHDILNYFGQGRIGGWAHDLGGVSWEAFWNRYGDFDKTNNLSLAVFVTFGKFTILFGGDLEKAGWKGLLKNPFFVSRLHEVDVYVASHHGRENGRCDELFDFMTPKIIIFSDGPKQ